LTINYLIEFTQIV